MTQKIGVVVHVFRNQTAEVMTDKLSACGGCADTRSCKSCLSGGNKVVAVVRNEPGARPGDIVSVEHTRGALWSSAALFYLFPVFSLLAGAFAGGILAAGRGGDESGGALMGGLIGLGLALFAVFRVSKSAYAGRHWVPRITKIVEAGRYAPESGSKRVPIPPSGSCCD
jgi:positive regulator of sigma E activity